MLTIHMNKFMPLYDKILLRKRSVIETINDELKNVAQLVHSSHRPTQSRHDYRREP